MMRDWCWLIWKVCCSKVASRCRHCMNHFRHYFDSCRWEFSALCIFASKISYQVCWPPQIFSYKTSQIKLIYNFIICYGLFRTFYQPFPQFFLAWRLQIAYVFHLLPCQTDKKMSSQKTRDLRRQGHNPSTVSVCIWKHYHRSLSTAESSGSLCWRDTWAKFKKLPKQKPSLVTRAMGAVCLLEQHIVQGQ